MSLSAVTAIKAPSLELHDCGPGLLEVATGKQVTALPTASASRPVTRLIKEDSSMPTCAMASYVYLQASLSSAVYPRPRPDSAQLCVPCFGYGHHADCSGQLIPDTTLSFSSARAGASPPLN